MGTSGEYPRCGYKECRVLPVPVHSNDLYPYNPYPYNPHPYNPYPYNPYPYNPYPYNPDPYTVASRTHTRPE